MSAQEWVTGKINSIEDIKLNSYNESNLNILKNKVFLDSKMNNVSNNLSDKLSNNEFMNLTINDLFMKLVNLIPNLYKDYYKIHLHISLKLRDKDKFVSEKEIIKETITNMIFNNKNIIYLGIIMMFISFLLYVINL